jgi:hypothetical protein
VFTARYALSPYIKQISFVFKGLIKNTDLLQGIASTSSWKYSSKPQIHGAPGEIRIGQLRSTGRNSLSTCQQTGRSTGGREKSGHHFLWGKAAGTWPRLVHKLVALQGRNINYNQKPFLYIFISTRYDIFHWIAILNMQKVLGSNLTPKTCYRDWVFAYFQNSSKHMPQ